VQSSFVERKQASLALYVVEAVYFFNRPHRFFGMTIADPALIGCADRRFEATCDFLPDN
jgi:hypothetical protein